MRNLRLFVIRHYFFILFLLLQVAALTMLSASSNYHKTSLFNTTGNVAGFFIEKKNEIGAYFHLRKANDMLLAENTRLRTMLKSSHYLSQNGIVRLGDSVYQKQFDFLPADVISGTVNKRNNYFTLNRGSLNGVEKGMGVISNGCMVGFVRDVSAHYSNVVTVLNEQFIQSVRMPRNNENGSITWDGRDPSIVELKYIPVDAKVHGGDSILTRGASGRFPNDIFVGTVYSVSARKGSGSGHHYIRVKLGIDLNSVYHVMLVKNKFRDEILKMEDAAK